MSKILLKVNDLSTDNENLIRLKHISFFVPSETVISLCGLNDSGADFLFQILSGEIPYRDMRFHIYYNNRAIFSNSDMANIIQPVYSGVRTVETWTVAEYLYLSRMPLFFTRKSTKQIYAQAGHLLDSLHVDIDPEQRLSDLSLNDHKLLELVKASTTDKKILLISDDFYECSESFILRYSELLHQILRQDKSALLLSRSDKAISLISDWFLIFRRGRLIKKLKNRPDIRQENIEAYILGESKSRKRKQMEAYVKESPSGKDVIMTISRIPACSQEISLSAGQIALFISKSEGSRDLRWFLKKRRLPENLQTVIQLNGKRLDCSRLESLFRQKVILLFLSRIDDNFFPQMSIGDNIALPSYSKIRFSDFFKDDNAIKDSALSALLESGDYQYKDFSDLKYNEKITILLERWYIFHPTVLILVDPFENCDIYDISIIRSYIKKFSSRGTIVLLFKQSDDYVTDLVDKTYIV